MIILKVPTMGAGLVTGFSPYSLGSRNLGARNQFESSSDG
jgi:hypothetical protein